MEIEVANGVTVTKRICWLAWQACRPVGMGILQDRPDATEEDVWDNIIHSGDYPTILNESKPGKVDADYVFGRMLKLNVEYTPTSVILRDTHPRPDYQSWCRTYPTYEKLVEAAIASFEVK